MVIITAVWVPGHPKTKGSLDFYGKGQVKETVDNKAWRELIADEVRRDIARRGLNSGWSEAPATGPIAVHLTFWLDHPDVYGPFSRAGDLDKLIRLVLDALTDAGVYQDDNQVATLPRPLKLPSDGEPGNAGVLILVYPCADDLADLAREARNQRYAVQKRLM
jgi:Holliday junction resolvase RusA-like endonuclease